jgi:transposase
MKSTESAVLLHSRLQRSQQGQRCYPMWDFPIEASEAWFFSFRRLCRLRRLCAGGGRRKPQVLYKRHFLASTTIVRRHELRRAGRVDGCARDPVLLIEMSKLRLFTCCNHESAVALFRSQSELLAYQASDPVRCDFALVVFAVLFREWFSLMR